MTEVNGAIDNVRRAYCVPFELPILFLSNYCLKFLQSRQAFVDFPGLHIFPTVRNIFILTMLRHSCGRLIARFLLKGIQVTRPILLNHVKNQSDGQAVSPVLSVDSWHFAHKRHATH